MWTRKIDADLIGIIGFKTCEINGIPCAIVAAGASISDGWAFAWRRERKLYEFVADDSPLNESDVVIYTEDIGAHRIIVAAHDERDAALLEDGIREETREEVTNG